MGNVALKSKFFRLFSFSVNIDVSLNLCEDWINSVWLWNLVWRRGLFDWEKLQVCQLLEAVQGSSLYSTIDNIGFENMVSLLSFRLN